MAAPRRTDGSGGVVERPYYTRACVRRLVRHWAAVVEAAHGAGQLRDQLGPVRSGPTPLAPRAGVRQKAIGSDRLGAAVIVADVRRAVAQLPRQEEAIVLAVMGLSASPGHAGGPIDEVARQLRLRKSTVAALFRAAVAHMAAFLDPEQEED